MRNAITRFASPSEYSSRNLIPNQTLRDRQWVVHRRRFIVSSMRLRRRISFKLFSESSHVLHTHFLASPPRTIYIIFVQIHTHAHYYCIFVFEIVTRTNTCIGTTSCNIDVYITLVYFVYILQDFFSGTLNHTIIVYFWVTFLKKLTWVTRQT